MKRSVYKFGYTYIELNMPDDMLMPDNMDKFRVDNPAEEMAMRYVLEVTDDIEAKEKLLLDEKVDGIEIRRDNFCLCQTRLGEVRRLNFQGDMRPYAVTRKKPEGVTEVWFDDKRADMLIYDTVFISALALEKVMIDADAMILHSAYMCYKNTAVLFSAPSGTGKSTQANLWEKYRGTYTVNGDKSLLIRETDGWYANGWPICGSSGICKNESHPIRAIVVLKQAKENKVYPLKGLKALRPVMEQITINTWDSTYQMKAMDQIEKLLMEVPIYCLECDISEDAVKCLENVIG